MGNEIVKDILREYDLSRDLYEAFGKSVADLLDRLLKANEIDFLPIEHRTKERTSLAGKIARPDKSGRYHFLSDLTDIAGIRIVAFLDEDCKKICRIIESNFLVDYENCSNKEEGLDPDRFGYLSRHYVIGHDDTRSALPEFLAYKGMRAEVQVRTVLQHSWAAIDWKLRYKSTAEVPVKLRRRLYRISALLEAADVEFSSIAKDASDIREYYRAKLSSGKYDIPIDAESMQIFLDTNSHLERLVKRAIREKFPIMRIPTETHGRLASLLYSLRAGGFVELKQINDFIKKDQKSHIAKLNDIFDAWERDGAPLSVETMIRALAILNSHPTVAQRMIDAAPISLTLGMALKGLVDEGR